MKLNYKISDAPSRFLKPDGFTGVVDVVEDFAWTLTPKSGRTDVPKLYFNEYSITAGQLVSSILYFGRILSGIKDETFAVFGNQNPSDIYKYKYIAEPTNFKYCVPFFSPQKTSRNTSFGYEDGENPFTSLLKFGTEAIGGFGQLKGITGALASGAKLASGESAYASALKGVANSFSQGKLTLEHPMAWTETNAGTYSVTFDLFNSGSMEDIDNNRSFCYLLAYQNTPSRRSFAIVDSVCIYDVWAGDTFHFPAAYISSLDIKNLGNVRAMKFGSVERNIPEAYRISITFNSLLMMTRQIMTGLDTGEKIQAIDNVQDVASTLANLISEPSTDTHNDD